MDGVLLGMFDTYGEVIDFVLKARHRVINMRSLLLQAADATSPSTGSVIEFAARPRALWRRLLRRRRWRP